MDLEKIVKNANTYCHEVYNSSTGYVPIYLYMDQHIVDSWPHFEGFLGYREIATLYHTEIVSNDSLPKMLNGGIFDGSNCKGYATQKEAEQKLADNLEAYINGEFIKNITPKRRIIFWRVKPEIRKHWNDEFGKNLYYGYARLGIYQE